MAQHEDLFDVLDSIRRRPSMFLGFDSDHRREQLGQLESVLLGYALALEAHGITEPGTPFLNGFRDFVKREYGLDTTCGPASAFISDSRDDQVAWTRFWSAVDRFRDECVAQRPTSPV